MRRSSIQSGNTPTFTLMLLIAVVAALYFAREVLIPLALATLLAFILAPAVDRLERWRLGRVPSILIVVLAVFAVLAGIGWLVGGQVVDFADNLPSYKKNILEKVQLIKTSRSGPLAKLQETVKDVSKELTKEEPAGETSGGEAGATKSEKDVSKELTKEEPAGETPGDQTGATESEKAAEPSAPRVATPLEDLAARSREAAGDRPVKPVPVEIVETTPASLNLLSELLPGALGWMATVGVVLVFLIFMLIAREDLRNRLIRLIGPEQIMTTTQALDDAADRVSRFLRMQLIVNTAYGLMLSVGLYFIGLPNALLWGVLGGILRYIPYVGPWLGAGGIVLLSLAIFPSWTMPLVTMTLVIAAELITNTLLEPILYKTGTGVSTMGILVAAVFWTWLWGSVGLVMAMPLTVCIVVMGRYVPQLEFLNVLLGDEPVLPPGAHYYQRLLVSDEEESRELVEDYLLANPPENLFDDVLLPALVLTEADTRRGQLTPDKQEYILESIRELLDELTVENSEERATTATSTAAPCVVIVPARDPADEVAGQILQLRLEMLGIEGRLLSTGMLLGEIAEEAGKSPDAIIFISAVPPFAVRHARGLCKRLHVRLPDQKIVAGIWGLTGNRKQVEERLRAIGAERVVGTVAEAIEQLDRIRPGLAKCLSETASAAEKVPSPHIETARDRSIPAT